MASDDLTRLETHFAFGRNWRSYASLIDEARIAAAAHGLLALLPREALAGGTFLDVGCGSGIHALAATRLGVTDLLATDIDLDAVETTRDVLARFGAATPHRVEQASILEMMPETHGTFHVVYAWGVLHHTGDVRQAIARAARLVGHDGWLAIALYGPTALDAMWRREKRWYAGASPRAQAFARGLFDACRGAPALRARARGIAGASREDRRGMDLRHDLHDWLGGYPYETIPAGEVDTILRSEGLHAVRVNAERGRIGVFGAGCNEYVYTRA